MISKPKFSFIVLEKSNTNPLIYRPLSVLLIFPFYQILIVFYGWLFGQFAFFWSFEKKMLSKLGFKRFFKDKK